MSVHNKEEAGSEDELAILAGSTSPGVYGVVSFAFKIAFINQACSNIVYLYYLSMRYLLDNRCPFDLPLFAISRPLERANASFVTDGNEFWCLFFNFTPRYQYEKAAPPKSCGA